MMRMADQIEVGEEASPEYDDQHRKVLPEVEAVLASELSLWRCLAMGLPAARPKAKKALMMPAKMATAIPLPKE